jgi:hypothetical protein
MNKELELSRSYIRRTSSDESLLEDSSQTWQERERWHSSYAATPLNSRHLKEPSGRVYTLAALQYVNELLREAVRIRAGQVTPKVYDQLEIALQSALLSRVEENERKAIPLEADNVSATLFAKACYGGASPEDLLKLLVSYPVELGSLELAKQSHPCEWSETIEMDQVVEDALVEHDFALRGGVRTQNVRYSLARVDDTQKPDVATFVRKADIGTRAVPGKGSLIVTQQDSMVVDFEHPDAESAYHEMQRWLRRPATADALKGDTKVYYEGKIATSFIDRQFETESSLRSPSVRPVVRSYYVYYKALQPEIRG